MRLQDPRPLDHIKDGGHDENDILVLNTEFDLMTSDSGIFKDLRLRKKDVINIGIQTALDEDFQTRTLSDKIEHIMEEKTKSIINVIKNNQMTNYFQLLRNTSTGSLPK